MLNSIFTVVGRLLRSKPAGPPSRNRAILHVEELGQRIMPSVYTYYTDTDQNHLWSDAKNWDSGLPDSTHIPVFTRTVSNDNVTFDNTVTTNQLGGLVIDSSYTGTITLNGNSMTITGLDGDKKTGFKMNGGTIVQMHAGDTIQIAGGTTYSDGTAVNLMSGGAINPASGNGAVSTLIVRGGLVNTASLLITGTTATTTETIGDNIIVGNTVQGSVGELDFNNQTVSLNLDSNVNITIGTFGATLNFQTVTSNTLASKAINTPDGSTSEIIDGGTLIRSGNVDQGTLQIDTPIYENASGALFEIQTNSGLEVTKQDSIYFQSVIAKGTVQLDSGADLQADGGFYLNGSTAKLITHGTSATMEVNTTKFPGANFLLGGIVALSQDDTTKYGTLTFTGPVTFNGTFNEWVNGQSSSNYSQLIDKGNFTIGANAVMNVNVNGTLNKANTWRPIKVQGTGNTLTGKFQPIMGFTPTYLATEMDISPT